MREQGQRERGKSKGREREKGEREKRKGERGRETREREGRERERAVNVAELVAAAQVSVLTPQNSNHGIKAKELYLFQHSIALRTVSRPPQKYNNPTTRAYRNYNFIDYLPTGMGKTLQVNLMMSLVSHQCLYLQLGQ